MSGLRRTFVALGLITTFVASTGSAYAANGAQAACAAMQHKCCKTLRIASCCRISHAPGDASTPAEGRFEVSPMAAAVASVPAILLLTPEPCAPSAVNGGPPPTLSPPDLFTLHSSLLI